MKRNLKSFLSFLFILSLAFFITACGSDSTSSDKDSNNDNNPPSESGNNNEQLSGEIIISTAVSLTDAVEEIKTAFNEEYPNVTVTYNYGSSGKLAEQISQGAPADIFLSASKKDMDGLTEKELIINESRFDFASNAVVVIAEKDSDVTLSTIEDLPNASFTNFAMGHTESMPLGRYAKEAFENANIWDEMEDKLVFGSDVRQVLSYVEQGNAELGVVFTTDTVTSDKVKVVLEVDPSLHGPIIYPAAIVKETKNETAANAYLQFLKDEKGRAILESFGFIVN